MTRHVLKFCSSVSEVIYFHCFGVFLTNSTTCSNLWPCQQAKCWCKDKKKKKKESSPDSLKFLFIIFLLAKPIPQPVYRRRDPGFHFACLFLFYLLYSMTYHRAGIKMTSSLLLSLRTLGIPLERHFVKGKAELLPGSSYHRTKSESLEKMLSKQCNFRKVISKDEKHRHSRAHFNTKQVFSRCTKEYVHKKKILSIFFK